MVATKTAVSAGGVIFRKQDSRIEVAVTMRGDRRIANLPKGLVEEGESLEEAALREVREETGLTGEIVDKIGRIDYWFYWKPEGTRIHKFVHFFLMRYKSGDTADHDWEVDEVLWLPIDEAIEKLTFKSERDIMQKAKSMIQMQGLTK